MSKQGRKRLWYLPRLKEKAKFLRNNSTLSEAILWDHLKNKQIRGYNFHRQKPIDQYIVDFFCIELMLAIEIDGRSHEFDEQYDSNTKRQYKIEKLGIKILSFDDLEVKKDIDNVLRTIDGFIEEFGEVSNES